MKFSARHSLVMLTLLLAATLCHSPGRAFAQQKDPQRWALLVGVNEYANIKDLRFCGADMQALRDELIAVGFPENHVFLLNSGAKDVRHRPFKAIIEKQLRLVLRLAERGDLIVVAFSGHGAHLDGKTYLCSAEAEMSEPATTMVSLETIYNQMRRSKASSKLLLVDACRNDPTLEGKKSSFSDDSLTALGQSLQRPPVGIVALTSCAEGQISMEDKKLGHGVFMHFILEGLRGAADKSGDGNKDDRVSLAELFAYSNVKTRAYVAQKFADFQTPKLKSEVTDPLSRFILGIPGTRVMARIDPPAFKGGKSITNSIGMKMVLIPAGEFMMGSGRSAAEIARIFESKAEDFENEHPQHRVKITKPFYLGAYEVTVGQFRKFVSAMGYKTDAEKDGEGGRGYNASTNEFVGRKPKYSWRKTGWTQTEDHPVVNVSWNDAVAFCEWLSSTEGKTYRLPTEAEWEYACRAGKQSLNSNGDHSEDLAKVGNVADATYKRKKPSGFHWGGIEADDGYVFTAPVGKFAPNLFGLYDMHGNVWEWCHDWYGETYYGQQQLEDPPGASTGDSRVFRGGCWLDKPLYVRSAFRTGDSPDYRGYTIGFRLAMTP